MFGAKKRTEGRKKRLKNLLKWHTELLKTANVNFETRIVKF